jgi:rubredoxin
MVGRAAFAAGGLLDKCSLADYGVKVLATLFVKLPISGSPFAFDGLDCPSCGGNYLHHQGIFYYNRSEDDENGDFVILHKINEKDQSGFHCSYKSNVSMKGCPSPRRDGMEVFFTCECCSAKSSLAIFQHKGQTFIEWHEIIIDEQEKPKRQPIKPSLRFEILKRDDYRCQMCGVTAKDGATLEIDHIHPVSKGGTNEPDNLQVLCRDCNAGKGAQCQ